MAERIRPIERLLAILDKPDPEIDRLWANEMRVDDASTPIHGARRWRGHRGSGRIGSHRRVSRKSAATSSAHSKASFAVVSIWSCPV